MPLFEFKCPECQLEFEELTSLAEREHVRCPRCGAQPVRRISGFVSRAGDAAARPGRSTPSSCSSASGFS